MIRRIIMCIEWTNGKEGDCFLVVYFFFRVEAWLILDNHENVSTVVFFLFFIAV